MTPKKPDISDVFLYKGFFFLEKKKLIYVSKNGKRKRKR